MWSVMTHKTLEFLHTLTQDPSGSLDYTSDSTGGSLHSESICDVIYYNLSRILQSWKHGFKNDKNNKIQPKQNIKYFCRRVYFTSLKLDVITHVRTRLFQIRQKNMHLGNTYDITVSILDGHAEKRPRFVPGKHIDVVVESLILKGKKHLYHVAYRQ